jgi:hypothetical protein
VGRQFIPPRTLRPATVGKIYSRRGQSQAPPRRCYERRRGCVPDTAYAYNPAPN